MSQSKLKMSIVNIGMHLVVKSRHRQTSDKSLLHPAAYFGQKTPT